MHDARMHMSGRCNSATRFFSATTCVPLAACCRCGQTPDKCSYCYSVWPFDGAVEPVYPVYMASNKRCQKVGAARPTKPTEVLLGRARPHLCLAPCFVQVQTARLPSLLPQCVNQPLASGCQSCNAVGRCESCATGYVLSNGACKKVSCTPCQLTSHMQAGHH